MRTEKITLESLLKTVTDQHENEIVITGYGLITAESLHWELVNLYQRIFEIFVYWTKDETEVEYILAGMEELFTWREKLREKKRQGDVLN